MNFAVALEATYSPGKLNLFNHGSQNLWLWGIKLGDDPKTLENEGRLLTPGGLHYLLTAPIENGILSKIDPGQQGTVLLEVYLKNAIGTPYVVQLRLVFVADATGQLTIHSQATSIAQANWNVSK